MTLRVHPDEIVRESTSSLLAIHPTWERVRLSDVADVLNGFAFRSAYFSNSEGVPLLRIRDVGRSQTEASYVGEFDPAYLVEAGSLVVGMDGDFRVARWTGPPALLNQRVCKISVRDDSLYDAGFLFYALPGYLDAINARTSSVTVKHLSSRTVQEIPLPLPPLAERRRIVAAIEEHFSRLDAAIRSLQSGSRRLERLRGQILAASIDALDAPRFPVADVAHLVTDGDHNPPARAPNGVPHLTAKNVKGGRLTLDGCTFVSEEGFEQTRRRYEPRSGDVIVTCVGTIGEVAVVPPGFQFSADRNLAAIRPRPEVDASYLALALRTPRRKQAMRGASGSTAQPHLYLRDLRALEIPLPLIDEQRRIVAEVEQQLSVVDAMAAEIDRALRRSTALRRSILERAFSGKLVPQDPSDEPASALLERIRAERAAAETATGRRRRRRATMRAR